MNTIKYIHRTRLEKSGTEASFYAAKSSSFIYNIVRIILYDTIFRNTTPKQKHINKEKLNFILEKNH